MPTLYSPEGQAVLCDNDQMEAMLASGYLVEAPAAEPVAEATADAGEDAKGKGKGK